MMLRESSQAKSQETITVLSQRLLADPHRHEQLQPQLCAGQLRTKSSYASWKTAQRSCATIWRASDGAARLRVH
eukprot:scaffold677268_cov41-Prasinocladus_malaysianus.AAC.1